MSTSSGGIERQEKQPATEEITEVAPGVLRSQLPIDMPGLGHVNCYFLEDENGLAVVDPGLPDQASWDALVQRLGTAGYTPDNVHTVVVTHSHLDHYGGATRLVDGHGAKILAHESFGSRLGFDDDSEFADFDAVDENGEPVAPWDMGGTTPWGTRREPPPQFVIDEWKKSIATGGSFTPTPHIRVTDAQSVTLARREWVAVHTPGHTNDHLCLYDPTEGTMLSGDHVLPTITPHIGGDDSGEDTLGTFMDSLQRMHDYSDVRLALPAHGHPFADLDGRAEHICEHHVERLDDLRSAAKAMGTGSVNEYMKGLFRERSWGYMAERETFAHLEHLRQAGELTTARDGELLLYSWNTTHEPADATL